MNKRIIISGGGTGGHIFPAISIANALKRIDKEVDILFVGALGRIEMSKVPQAGYRITGLPVAGFVRKLSLKNISVIFRLFISMRKASSIISSFKPDVVVGVGGYASGPVLRVAGRKRIPTLIQEQNSYAGLTNKLLARKAKVICVAYEGMDKYFPADKILLTGNPIRKDLFQLKDKREAALEHFGLDGKLVTVLVLGGSGGSRTINESIAAGLGMFGEHNIQVVWQTGKFYYERMNRIHTESGNNRVKVYDFINRMDLAYSVADIIVSRAGAGTISELCVVGKPVILIPSPNVAEDHQTKNAKALEEKAAALMIRDDKSVSDLAANIILLIEDKDKREKLSENISSMAICDSDEKIANEILKLAV